MAEIISFISGCIFTLLLTGGCLYISYKVIQFREDTDVRREEKKKRTEKKIIPNGGVIRPKTFAQLEMEKDEQTQALLDLINDPGTE